MKQTDLSYKILRYIGWLFTSPAFILIYLIGLFIGIIIGLVVFSIMIIFYMILLFLFIIECLKGDVT